MRDPRRSTARALITTLFAVLWLTGGLTGFETIGVVWTAGRASFWLNPNFPDAGLAGMTDEQERILLCAAGAWRDQSRAAFQFNYQGRTAVRRTNDQDGINAVFWSNSDGGEALAATLISGDNGRAIAFDIIFFASSDGSTNRWSGPGEPAGGEFDIQGVAVHELGHALGLDHSSTPQTTMSAVVSGSGLGLRTLHLDDRNGAESLYGLRAQQAPQVQLTTVSPASGPTSGANEVIIEGVNFTYDSDSTLTIDGRALASSLWEVESCGRIRIAAMPSHGAGSVDIRVGNTVGVATLDNAYRYGGPAPVLGAVEPPVGPLAGGILLTIEGQNLTADAIVTIGGKALLDAIHVDARTIEGTLPAGAAPGPVDVRLVQGADSAVLPGGFTYNPYVLSIGDARGAPGEQGVPLEVRATSPDPLSGVSFGVVYDAALAVVQDISVAGTAAAAAEFAAADIDAEAGTATFGLVMSLTGSMPSFPAGTGVLLARILTAIEATAQPGEAIALRLEDEVGSPPIQLIFTRVGEATRVRPLTEDGRLLVSAGAPFLRGDANSDRKVDISDPIFHLSFLFQGDAEPRCRDAADANDDGALDISDAINTILSLFQSQEPLPPPFPTPGLDPTPDGLGCAAGA